MTPIHEMFTVPSLFVQVLVAIATGSLIGLERERLPDRKFAGLRTLALLCAAGPVVVSLGQAEGESLLLGLFLGIYLALTAGLALAVAAIRYSLDSSEVGFTTSITVFLVGLLGILVGYERYIESTSIAIVVVLLLAERERLHGYVEGLSDQELLDSLKLGALVFVLYPITPTDPIDPYGVVVLRDVLLFVIFVLLIEFGSYVSMAQFGGSRGLAVTGLLAGGANSFAAAGVLARLANRSRDALTAASFALLLATTSMIARNVAIAVALAVPIFPAVWPPALAMVAVTVAAAVVVWVRGDTHDEFDIELDSPFSFVAAVKFAAIYVGILVFAVVAEALVGDAGLYLTSFVGGLVSSAAVSVTAATVLSEGTVTAEPAAGMVVLGITASITSKIVLVEVVNGEMRGRVIAPLAVVALTGCTVFLLL